MQRIVVLAAVAALSSGCSWSRVQRLPALNDRGPDRPECTTTHRHQVGDFFGALGFGLLGVSGATMAVSPTATNAGRGIGGGFIGAGVVGLALFAASTHWGRVHVNECQAAVARWDLDHAPAPVVYSPPPPPELTSALPAVFALSSQEQGFDAAARALALSGWPILTMDRGSGVIQTGGYSSRLTDRNLKIAVVATSTTLVVTPMVSVVRGGNVIAAENWDNDLRTAFGQLVARVATLIGSAPLAQPDALHPPTEAARPMGEPSAAP